MSPSFRSRLVRILLDPRVQGTRRFLAEAGRQLRFKRHSLQVFLQLDDPYSYLLAHYLRILRDEYKVDVKAYLSQALQAEYMPEPAKQIEHSNRDAALLAAEIGVPFLDKGTMPVVEHRRALLNFLAEEQEQIDFLDVIGDALAAYWRGDAESVARLVGNFRSGGEDTTVLIAKNQLLLRKLGHYSSAVVFYGGEWYWGIDRFPYLLDRLERLGARETVEVVEELASLRQTMRVNLPATVPESASALPPLDYYFSFRSPYSYLSMQRTFDVANAFGIELRMRPVLPMVMRGLPVPRNKLRYIVFDANREAQRLGVPFGKPHDPVGAGVERCMAVFSYARSQGKDRVFMLAAASGIWSRAVDVSTDEGLQSVTEQSGLFWPDVQKALADDSWRAEADANRQSLTEAGLWGVPVYVFGDTALWGQDRDWLLVRAIENQCSGSDGIAV